MALNELLFPLHFLGLRETPRCHSKEMFGSKENINL